MSQWWAQGRRKSVKLGILVVGLIGAAITSTGISLAMEPAVQLEICGNGRSGQAQLSGRNQDGQGTSNNVSFPANGCQLLGGVFWALPQVQAVVTFDDDRNNRQNVNCDFGGSADRSTVKCNMPGGQPPTQTTPPTQTVAEVPTPESCNVTVDDGSDTYVRGYSLGKTGGEAIGNVYCGMDRVVHTICQNRGFGQSDYSTTKITGPVLRPNGLYRADFERQCSVKQSQ